MNMKIRIALLLEKIGFCGMFIGALLLGTGMGNGSFSVLEAMTEHQQRLAQRTEIFNDVLVLGGLFLTAGSLILVIIATLLQAVKSPHSNR